MDKSATPALSRGLNIIELIAVNGSMSYNRLEKASSLNASSFCRILKVLTESDYIRKDAQGEYTLGVKLFSIAQMNSVWTALLQNVSPLLRQLSENYKVAASLYAYTSRSITVIERFLHPDNIAMREVGDEKDDYLLSPWGFLYMYELPEANRADFIDEHR